jgi:hypothetical protein
MNDRQERCELCLYARSHGFILGENMLQCRRHAPRDARAGMLRGFSTWPIVKLSEWCGDFAPACDTEEGEP